MARQRTLRYTVFVRIFTSEAFLPVPDMIFAIGIYYIFTIVSRCSVRIRSGVFAGLLYLGICSLLFTASCSRPEAVSAQSSYAPPQPTTSTAQSISVPADTSATLPTPTPTRTPTPTPTPSPTPTPTPEPEYIEPILPEPVWYNGYVDPRSIRAEVVTNPEDIGVLVNKYYAMPADYVPDLVYAESSNGQQLRPEAAEAWDLMRADCLDATGYQLYLVSGYRSYGDQTYSFSNAIVRRGIDKVCEKNAYQGRSEHSLGLALDINTADDPEIRDEFAETAAGEWVGENGHLYGFILRYPRDKGAIIGYGYEAWHYRYVGVEIATEMYEQGIVTLEEYYGKEQIIPEDVE